MNFLTSQDGRYNKIIKPEGSSQEQQVYLPPDTNSLQSSAAFNRLSGRRFQNGMLPFNLNISFAHLAEIPTVGTGAHFSLLSSQWDGGHEQQLPLNPSLLRLSGSPEAFSRIRSFGG